MSIILLADDSPHAQRMGERILRDEGFEVASVTNGETALVRMTDVDPDLVIADVFLPGRNGFELCRVIKEKHRHVRVILTAGMLEPFDEDFWDVLDIKLPTAKPDCWPARSEGFFERSPPTYRTVTRIHRILR